MPYFADVKTIATSGSAADYTKAQLVAILQSVYTDMRKFAVLKSGDVEAFYMQGHLVSLGGIGMFTETLDKYHLPYSFETIEGDFPAEYLN